ncbi:MAG: AI-2E family transporter [Bacilli bacterium]|nr:AI-2E family transporter [Bacilli bacterium]
MFHFHTNNKEKEVDITSLNHILRVGKNLIDIGYIMAIVCIILLGTYLLKEWNIFKYIGELLMVISPIFIGFLIAWLFEPLVSSLQSRKLPRIVGCILVYLVLLGSLFLIIYLFVPSLVYQVKDFVTAAPKIFEDITDFIIGFVEKLNLGSLVKVDNLKENVMKNITEWGLGIGSDVPKYLLSVGKSIISGGFNFSLGLMIGFYLLFDFDKVNHTIYSLIPTTWKENYKELTHRINTSLRSYVQGVLLVMFLVFITQGVGLSIAGMKAPILFALFCAVTDIIPYFGPYIGALPAVIVGFTISPLTGVCVIISILVVQLLENNFYQPLIMGHTMKLHPVAIMAGLLIFQHFFGIIGMVIATPCIACCKVILVFILEQTGIIGPKKETQKEIKE